MFHLSTTICTETLLNGQPSSTLLIYFSGILGFTSNGNNFCQARAYTPLLSTLIYIQRILLLKWALPFRAYTYIYLPKRSASGQQDAIQEVRRTSLTFGCDGPFHELLSLRNFGKAWARDEPPSVFLQWSDDGQVVSYNDDMHFSIQQFRLLINHFLTAAETLSKRLLVGIQPQIDLSQLQDKISNNQLDFSFVHHGPNRLKQEHLRLLTNGNIYGGTSLMHNGEWNRAAVVDYLKTVSQFKKTLVGGLYTACRQAPRAEEL